MHLAQTGFPAAGIAATQRQADIVFQRASDGANVMLGYFGIYSQYGNALSRNIGAPKRRFPLGLLPHEIAELNARSAARGYDRRPVHAAAPAPAERSANPA